MNTQSDKKEISKSKTAIALTLAFWGWECIGLPFILNQSIVENHLNPLRLAMLLTVISVGIPHLFCCLIHNSAFIRKIFDIHDIPALPTDKFVNRTIGFGWLLYLNAGLDVLAHFGIYLFRCKRSLNDENGELIESHLYSNYIYDFVLPFFIIELIYDLIYYWWHYYGHKNAFLWKYVHNVHHEIIFPRYLDVYHMSLWETVFLRVSIFALHDIFRLSTNKMVTMIMIQHYITFAEMMGHSGFTVKAEDVVLSRFILSQFGMTINVVHHDYHHQKCGTNYCKRLGIWDRVFGTFVDPKIPQKHQ